MRIGRLTLLATVAGLSGTLATVASADASKLGNELTPVGAIRAANADGSIPEWKGEELFTDEQKNLTRAQLETWRKENPEKIRNLVYSELEKRKADIGDVISLQFTITAENYKEYADKLTEGHKALFEKYPDTYKMPVYNSVRTGFFPQEIYDATIKNAKNAS